MVRSAIRAPIRSVSPSIARAAFEDLRHSILAKLASAAIIKSRVGRSRASRGLSIFCLGSDKRAANSCRTEVRTTKTLSSGRPPAGL